jgi:hypothetical protein
VLLELATLGALVGPGHPIEIAWDAPPTCPDAAWARAEVQRYVGDSLGETRATQLSFRVSIAEGEGGFVAEIETVTDGGTRRRRLPHSDCGKLSEGAAIIIALAIDPATIGEVDPEALGAIAEGEDAPPAVVEEEPPPPPEEKVVQEPAVPSPPPASPPPRRGLRPWWGAARAAFDFGIGRLPTIDLGGTAGVTVGGGPLRIEVLGGAWAPRTIAVADGSRAVFWAWSVGARVGGAIPIGRIVEVPILAGVDVGQLRADGRGLARPAGAAPLVGHVHLVPGVTVWVHPNVGLLFEADLFVPWIRPTFSVAGRGEVYQALPVGFHPAVGVLARLPARKAPPGNGSGAKRKQ